jgi:hypothetical protein
MRCLFQPVEPTGEKTLLDSVQYLKRVVFFVQRHLRLPCLALGAMWACAGVGPAWAGFVTTHEADLDKIFSQSAFGARTIDIRFNPTITVSEPSLLTINTETDLERLFALGGNSPTTVDLFFVDSINECGGEVLPPAIGCSQQPGTRSAVESKFAALAGSPGTIGLGATLIAHELAHPLGLVHVAPPPFNLMNPSLSGNTTLTADQVDTILGIPGHPGSPLVQIDQNGQRFISITPFAIVPEPATMLFALAGGAWLLQRARRRPAA